MTDSRLNIDPRQLQEIVGEVFRAVYESQPHPSENWCRATTASGTRGPQFQHR